jgi:hypothetical protein
MNEMLLRTREVMIQRDEGQTSESVHGLSRGALSDQLAKVANHYSNSLGVAHVTSSEVEWGSPLFGRGVA